MLRHHGFGFFGLVLGELLLGFVRRRRGDLLAMRPCMTKRLRVTRQKILHGFGIPPFHPTASLL
jgi:hypothetical protein